MAAVILFVALGLGLLLALAEDLQEDYPDVDAPFDDVDAWSEQADRWNGEK